MIWGAIEIQSRISLSLNKKFYLQGLEEYLLWLTISFEVWLQHNLMLHCVLGPLLS